MPEKFKKGPYIRKMYAITRCTVLDIQTREKNFLAGIINILKNSRVQKY